MIPLSYSGAPVIGNVKFSVNAKMKKKVPGMDDVMLLG